MKETDVKAKNSIILSSLSPEMMTQFLQNDQSD